MRQVRKQPRQKKKNSRQMFNTYCSIAFVMLLLFSSTLYSVVQVSAAQGFNAHDKAWDSVNNTMPRQADTYPYNCDTVTAINSVGLDTAYGTMRSLVQYCGEVPYDACYTDGEAIDAFEGIYGQRGTGLQHCTTDGWVCWGDRNNVGGYNIDAYTFWGIHPTNMTCNDDGTNLTWESDGDVPADENGKVSLADLEAVNSSDVVSLRLYALSNSSTPAIVSNIFYMLVNGIAWVCIWVLSLLVSIKNIDSNFILDVLHLDDLMEQVTSVMIYDSESGQLSIFMAFALVMFVFGIVAFVWRYVSGKDKANSVVNILVTVAAGAVVIGMCLAGTLSTLGSSFSNLTTSVISTVAGAMNDSAKVFQYDIVDSDPANANKICQMQEMALINKGYIDLQICTQFRVDDVNDLNFSELGISTFDTVDSSTARGYLYGCDGANTYWDFNNNLGYYFWYADSSANEKVYRNTEFPSTNTAAGERKLQSMITLLQHTYNNTTDQTKKDNIKNIIVALARPDGLTGFLALGLYIAIVILMMLVTWKYALGVLIGKLELFVALIGFAFAGPLIVTGKEKLVKTGKTILGLLVVAFIEIVAYSILFDIVLMVVAMLISTNLLQQLVVLGLLLILWKFNPYIQEKIKAVIETAERTVCPEASQFKRTVKQRARTNAQNLSQWYDRREKTIGYDANGDPIKRKNEGNALSRVMHQANNALFADANSHQSAFKINAHDSKTLKKNSEDAFKHKRDEAHKKVKAIEDNINSEAEAQKSILKSNADKEVNSKINAQTKEWIRENLTAEEQSQFDAAKKAEATQELWAKSYSDMQKEVSEYNRKIAQAQMDRTLAEQANADTSVLDAQIKDLEAKSAKLRSDMTATSTEYQKAKAEAEKHRGALKKTVEENAMRHAVDKAGVFSEEEIANAEGDTFEEKVNNAIQKKAQDHHKTEMQTALQNSIAIDVEGDASTSLIQSGSKIGGANRVDKEQVVTTAVNMQKLQDLNNDVVMSTTEEATAKTAEAVNKAVQYGEQAQIQEVRPIKGRADSRTTQVAEAQAQLDKAKSMSAHTTAQKQAKEQAIKNAKANLKSVKAETKATRKENKAQADDAYAEYGGKGLQANRSSMETTRMMAQLETNIMGNSRAEARAEKEAKRQAEANGKAQAKFNAEMDAMGGAPFESKDEAWKQEWYDKKTPQ